MAGVFDHLHLIFEFIKGRFVDFRIWFSSSGNESLCTISSILALAVRKNCLVKSIIFLPILRFICDNCTFFTMVVICNLDAMEIRNLKVKEARNRILCSKDGYYSIGRAYISKEVF
jgi:hypothetical protein